MYQYIDIYTYIYVCIYVSILCKHEGMFQPMNSHNNAMVIHMLLMDQETELQQYK
jgi:hypothetical protein